MGRRDDASVSSPASPASHERDAALDELRALHEEVDEGASAMASRHGARLHCGRGCSGCCVDDLRVFEVEAERIRRGSASLLRDGVPHPEGACAFLATDGSCRIYADRPYVCRTQGLPLRWLEDDSGTQESGDIVERRDICPLNLEGPALETLPADDCWLLGPIESRIGAIQERFDGTRARVGLRSLFGRVGERR